MCPFELQFKLRIVANVNKHDYAILLQALGDEPFIEDPRDLQAFISQITAGRKMSVNFTVVKARYDEEIYDCIYIDFKRRQKNEQSS